MDNTAWGWGVKKTFIINLPKEVGGGSMLDSLGPSFHLSVHLQMAWFPEHTLFVLAFQFQISCAHSPCYCLEVYRFRGWKSYYQILIEGWDIPVDHCCTICSFWCAILIANQLLWQNMEAPVSIFQESSLAGEPRQRLFHIHRVITNSVQNIFRHLRSWLWQINGCNL